MRAISNGNDRGLMAPFVKNYNVIARLDNLQNVRIDRVLPLIGLRPTITKPTRLLEGVAALWLLPHRKAKMVPSYLDWRLTISP